MLNISYAAAYDPYHTAFRFLTLLTMHANPRADYEWLRIADFYLCFPQRLTEFRAPRAINGLKSKINRVVKALPDASYASLPDSRTIFDRMSTIQETALSALNKQRIVALRPAGDRRLVVLEANRIPEVLVKTIEESSKRQQELLEILAVDLGKIEILGPGGLKDRSGLGDFQYDTV